MYKYTLTIHTQHNRTAQDLLTSDDLSHLRETADRMKHTLYKDQAVIITESRTRKPMYKAERW